MLKQRRRPMHYNASSLYDGTVVAVFPVRKPGPRIIKRDRLRIDEDGVCIERLRAGNELRDWNYDGRIRFQNIIAINLNTRRAIRELALPQIESLQKEVAELREQVQQLVAKLSEQQPK